MKWLFISRDHSNYPAEETYDACIAALRLGYRHIDTAEVYKNEHHVGNALHDFLEESGLRREDIWITTKLRTKKRNYDGVIKAFADSLEKLRVEYVDLYLIHSPYDIPQRLEQWRALEDIKLSGKARSIGVSNYGVQHLEELLASCRIVPSINQVELTPFYTRRDLVTYCLSKNIAMEAYSPLTRGKRLNDEKLVAMATKYLMTPAQLLIKWCLQCGYVKSSRPERILENMRTLELDDISSEDLEIMNSWNENYATGWDPTTSP